MTTKKINSLVQLAQQGDKEALEKLYNHFFNQIYYYTYSRVSNRHDAEEIVSDTFVSLVEGITKYQGKSSFKNYLFGIAKNKLRDYIRNKYKQADFVLESTFSENSFENAAVIEEEQDKTYRNKIRKVLKQIYKSMKPRYAKVLNLRFNEMNSIDETAKILGLTENNVKVIQHRAIKQAKAIWEKMEVNG